MGETVMNNNPISRRWRLDLSIRVVPYTWDNNGAENTIDVLHCFAPQPFSSVAPVANIGREKRLLAGGRRYD